MGKGRQAVPINFLDGCRHDGHASLCPSYGYMPALIFLACLGVYVYPILNENLHFAKGSSASANQD